MREAVRRSAVSALDTLASIKERIGFSWRAWWADGRFPSSADSLLSGFLGDAPPGFQAYTDLMRYLLTGFETRRSPLGAGADYCGMRSYNGPAMDRLEGFSRIAPVAAAWLGGDRQGRLRTADDGVIDLAATLRSGIVAGTDPASAEYWGDVKHWRQSIVEAADIALALWLSRQHVWDTLSTVERDRIGRWLIQVNGKRIPDNNWHLFVVQVNVILAALGMPHDAGEAERHYTRAKAFYRGGGWFRDGEANDTPGFDYYNAWGFHYHLQWLKRINPHWDRHFIDDALGEFVATYRYLMGPRGFPVVGRSACYRMAAPAPMIFAQDSHPQLVSPGQARRALDAIWQFFIRWGALRRGNVTQGYFGPDARLLEDYSGPASCLWSLRSLVPALALPDHHPFWQSAPEPLPVERGDYRIAIEPPGWIVVGDGATGVITIETGRAGLPGLDEFRLLDRVRGAFSITPHRPKNVAAKYYRARYDSEAPYGCGEPTAQCLTPPA